MIALKRKTNYGSNDNLVIITKSFKANSENTLSKEEGDYIASQISQHKKDFVSLQHLGRQVFVVIADGKKPLPQLLEFLRKKGDSIATALNAAKKTAVYITSKDGVSQHILAMAEGIALGNYQFIEHRTDKEKVKNTLKEVYLAGTKITDKQVAELSAVVEAVSTARDLVNQPVNHLNATGLAKAFQKLGKDAGFSVEVFNKAKIESLKMGGLLAVNQGSVDPPTFTIMEYKPSRKKNKKPYVLVGKGLVYDTGGLSLKPTANSMDQMKCDMAGGAAVGAIMYAIAKSKLPIHVIGLVPSTDNRPGGNAFAPGDIITMHDGSTVEMLNSDAEGRMILGDALSYAKKFDPELVCEFSTLTGAASVAIGPQGIVCMGTAADRFKERLKKSGNNVYERLVEFPFWEEYDELLKSDIADVKNIGGPYAGAITAGRFLKRFTSYPYMHFDIAGPAFLTAKDGYRTKGGTGVGVRLMYDFFKNL